MPNFCSTALLGEFKDGEMVEAVRATVEDFALDNRGILVPKFRPVPDDVTTVYRFQVSNQTSIPHPMVRDPYEEIFLVHLLQFATVYTWNGKTLYCL